MKLLLKRRFGRYSGEADCSPNEEWPKGLKVALMVMIFLSLTGGAAHADEIIMKNGDRIQGQVVSLASGKLVFKTSYAGEIAVDWSKVSRLTTEETLEVMLDDKQILKGKVVSSSDGALTVEPEKGTPGPPVEMAQVKKMAPPKPPETWKLTARVSAGASKNSGNTQTESYNLDGQLALKKFPHKIKLYAEYARKKDDGVVTEDNGLASLKYDRYISEKWFLFGNALGARDTMKDLTFQGKLGGGLGYQVWSSDHKNLSISLGPNYVYETYSKPMQEFDNKDYRRYVALYWNVDFDIWILKNIVQGFHHNDGTVDVRDGENWHIRTRTGFRFPLKYGLFTSLQYNYDFVNVPADGKKQYDEAYIFKLGWEM